MAWKAYFASATGKRHLDLQAACQDAGRVAVVGEVLLAAVCDGAGSVREGRRGAATLAAAVTARLAAWVAAGRWDAATAPDWHAELLALVESARADVDAVARQDGLALSEFATTLLGCVARPGAGCFFHVGDGFGVHLGRDGWTTLSPPENGEYADQTYFVTSDGWQEHFRVTPLNGVGPGSLIGLMSDGASPFAIDRSRAGFHRPFLDPVVAYLAQAGQDEGERALHGVLADERTFAITTDDKSLLLALLV